VSDFRVIPSIEQLRQRPAVRALEERFGATATVDALRRAASELRQAIAGGTVSFRTESSAIDQIEAGAAEKLRAAFRPSLEPVINATGVIVHTNLGRAPLARVALDRIAAVAAGYSTLEYDLQRGGRGRRDIHAEALLCRLTGAESAVVVNNNAAATLLILAALASGREVIVSRGELVEIGGGFRVPDVMAQSGAVLREVGTTNKTRAADYAAAVNDRTALVLRVHPSNFRVEGFTERPSLADLIVVGRQFNVPVAEDLGSGLLAPVTTPSRPRHDPGTTPSPPRHDPVTTAARPRHDRVTTASPPRYDPGTTAARPRHDPVTTAAPPRHLLGDEPAVGDSVSAGVDVCCFSGDKLLGGPQAGIIVGRTAIVDRIRRHPLMRALRVDKMTYAALEATLAEYAAGRAASTVPVQQMLTATADDIRPRAHALAAAINALDSWRAEVIDGVSAVGGGSAPGVEIATPLVAISKRDLGADALEERLRALTPPIIARIERDRVVIDLRTVLSDSDGQIAALLREA
jgi:L-seryl-tRNA(Ser) seleniumtransferase